MLPDRPRTPNRPRGNTPALTEPVLGRRALSGRGRPDGPHQPGPRLPATPTPACGPPSPSPPRPGRCWPRSSSCGNGANASSTSPPSPRPCAPWTANAAPCGSPSPPDPAGPRPVTLPGRGPATVAASRRDLGRWGCRQRVLGGDRAHERRRREGAAAAVAGRAGLGAVDADPPRPRRHLLAGRAAAPGRVSRAGAAGWWQRHPGRWGGQRGHGRGGGGQPPAPPQGRLAAGRPRALQLGRRLRLLLHPLRAGGYALVVLVLGQLARSGLQPGRGRRHPGRGRGVPARPPPHPGRGGPAVQPAPLRRRPAPSRRSAAGSGRRSTWTP